MKTFKRITVFLFVVMILAANIPLCAFAVDPVSSAALANGLAQAITAYGASHSVSMMYDVSNTDGIGSGMHDLWQQFKSDVNDNDVPDYDSLAVTVWSTLFRKVGNQVGVFVSEEVTPYFDQFWNWLLSGPAEMLKVDNQYYEWSVDSVTNSVSSILVLNTSGFSDQPIGVGNYSNLFQDGFFFGTNGVRDFYVISSVDDSYAFAVLQSGENYYLVVASANTGTAYYGGRVLSDNSTSFVSSSLSYYSNDYGLHYCLNNNFVRNVSIFQKIPVYDSLEDALYDISLVSDGQIIGSSFSVAPYVGDAVPQDVYIPDNDDVNYTPLPYVGGLDIPWDNTLYGDGIDTLTDSQIVSISSDLSAAIESDGTLTLSQEAEIVIPSEVYIPFLPVTLPTFNFSLSGIWHYVTAWVSSLGAWFTMVFTIWSNLPYAISLPVYATAVVVIVLGVYKRFFM